MEKILHKIYFIYHCVYNLGLEILCQDFIFAFLSGPD